MNALKVVLVLSLVSVAETALCSDAESEASRGELDAGAVESQSREGDVKESLDSLEVAEEPMDAGETGRETADKGRPSGECHECCPGRLRCGSSTEVLVCKDDGFGWEHYKTCAEGFTCKGTNCVKFEDTGCSVSNTTEPGITPLAQVFLLGVLVWFAGFGPRP